MYPTGDMPEASIQDIYIYVCVYVYLDVFIYCFLLYCTYNIISTSWPVAYLPSGELLIQGSLAGRLGDLLQGDLRQAVCVPRFENQLATGCKTRDLLIGAEP